MTEPTARWLGASRMLTWWLRSRPTNDEPRTLAYRAQHRLCGCSSGMSRWLCVWGLVVLAATACTSNGNLTSPNPSAVSTPTGTSSPPPGPNTCPITLQNGETPPGERRSPDHHGNGALWTVLPADGKIWAAPNYILPDGSTDIKFPWWRGIHGALNITGRRLDMPAPPLRADIPEGYGLSGFQASGVIFPTEGCWEVTGRVSNVSLIFVTLVVKPT